MRQIFSFTLMLGFLIAFSISADEMKGIKSEKNDHNQSQPTIEQGPMPRLVADDTLHPNAIGKAILACRESLFQSGLVSRDDNDLWPGKKELGFQFDQCVYSSYGAYRLKIPGSDASLSIIEVQPQNRCIIEFPHIKNRRFRLTFQIVSVTPAATFRKGMLRPLEKEEEADEKKCVPPPEPIDLKAGAISAHVTDDDGYCMSQLQKYFSDGLQMQLFRNIGHLKRLALGIEDEAIATYRQRKAAQDRLKELGLPLAEKFPADFKKLFKNFEACRDVPLTTKQPYEYAPPKNPQAKKWLEQDPEWFERAIVPTLTRQFVK